jgi:hypothetical protein
MVRAPLPRGFLGDYENFPRSVDAAASQPSSLVPVLVLRPWVRRHGSPQGPLLHRGHLGLLHRQRRRQLLHLLFFRQGEEVLRVALERRRRVLGRGVGSDVVIPDAQLSPRQVALFDDGRRCALEDLSGQGTVVIGAGGCWNSSASCMPLKKTCRTGIDGVPLRLRWWTACDMSRAGVL